MALQLSSVTSCLYCNELGQALEKLLFLDSGSNEERRLVKIVSLITALRER